MSRPVTAPNGTIYYDHNTNIICVFYNDKWNYISSIDPVNVDDKQILRDKRKEKIIQINGRI